MDRDTLKILRDPEDCQPLQLIDADEGAVQKSHCLLNPNTGKSYEIKNGIPIFLENEVILGSNRRYQKFYDKIARIYDPFNRIYYILRHNINYRSEEIHRKYLLEEIKVNPGDKVLEVGVGPGSNLRFLPPEGKYYGVDLSLGMLNSCSRNLKKRGLKAELFQALAENLPFKDNVFNTVYHIGGFNLFNDKQKAINEMIRTARPGAKIVIIDETSKSEKAAYEKVPLVNKIYSNKEKTFSLPLDLIPKSMEEVKVRELYNGVLYSLSFRVPLEKN